MSGDATVHVALWQHGAALAFVVIDICARAGRISALLPVRMTRAMIVNCCGDAIAALTPARLGGEPLRYVGYMRNGSPGPAVLAAFATETVLDAIVLGAGALVLLLFFTNSGWPATKQVLMRAGTGPIPMILLAGTMIAGITLMLMSRRAAKPSARFATFLRETWSAFRAQAPAAVTRAGVCTAISILARMAILPVLLLQVPGITPSALILGSAAALYVLLLVPTPGGVGVVEAGFFAGFGDSMTVGQVAMLIITWRAYAWVCSAGVGAVLLLRERLGRIRFAGLTPLADG